MTFVILPPKLRAEARRGRRRIMYAESGNRIGESHPKAVLTDHEVELLLELREENPAVHTYAWLAEKFEVSTMTVRSICRGRTRGIAAVRVVVEVCDV